MVPASQTEKKRKEGKGDVAIRENNCAERCRNTTSGETKTPHAELVEA
jgi:hypothetical protein